MFKSIYYRIIVILLLMTSIAMQVDWWQFVKPPAIYIA